MAPLSTPIEVPSSLVAGDIELRVIRARDSRALESLLTRNRDWLEQWEATHPAGRGPAPGSVSMRPMIRAMRAQMTSGSGVPFVIVHQGQLVGQLSVSEVSGGALRSCQIGYWVSKHVAGRGIAPLSVALAIDCVFMHVGLHRVEICIRPENVASLRVVEKLGMRYEGLRRAYIHIDGAWCDHDSFAVTREEVPDGMVQRLLSAQ